MKIYGDYHTHTVFSHGKGTIRENAEAGIKKGLKEIAITDHGFRHISYGVKRKNIKVMREEINALNQEYEGRIRILLGIEANVIGYDGKIDVDDEMLSYLDILLLGYHFGAIPSTFSDGNKLYFLNPLGKISLSIREKMAGQNTEALINAMNRYPIDIITHPGSKVPVDIKQLSRAAAERGVSLEINSHHSQLSVENIRIAMEEKVTFYINSDAHIPEDVGNIDEGIERALKAGLPFERILNIRK